MSTQRRPVTYGKQAAQHAFSTSFKGLDATSPTKSRLLKAPPLSLSPARKSQVESADPFDVPTSDSDSDGYSPPGGFPTSLRTSPVKKLSKTQKALQKTPPPQPLVQASRFGMRDTHLTTQNGKRKRTPSVAGSRQSSRATSPAGSTKSTFTNPGRITRANSAEPRRHQNASSTTGRTPATAPPKQRSVTSTNVRKRQKTPTPAGVSSTRRLPKTNVAETIEEVDEDVYDIPLDQTSLLNPVEERPAKIQKTLRQGTPASELLESPKSRAPSATPKPAKIVTTPRQARLWSNLLDDESGEIANESISTNSESALKRKADMQLEAPQIKAPRVRLIDTLKAAESQDDVEDEPELSILSQPSATKAKVPDEDDEPPSSQGRTRLESSFGEPSQSASQTNGPRITYAQQRSYLQDEPTSLDQLLAQPLELDETPVAKKNQKLAGGSLSFDDEEDETDTGGMKTIHELRAAGDELRFDDDMNTMLDDISTKRNSGLSAKRSALMDLATKLKDPQLKERFVGRSLEYEVLKRCEGELDPISGLALCVCLVTILSEPCDPRSAQLILEAGSLTMITGMMELSKDIRTIARDRKMNMARMAQSSVSELVDSLDSTLFWRDRAPSAVSPQILATRALELLVRRLREGGVTESLLRLPMVSRLVDMLAGSNKLLSADTSTHSESMSLETALSVLESGTVAPACALDASLWSLDSLAIVSRTVTKLIGLPRPDLIDIQTLALRLCLNLANNNERASAAFANPDLVGHLMSSINKGFANLHDVLNDANRQNEFDELVLALGAMFNLAEMSEEVRLLMPSEQPRALAEMVKTFSAAREKADQADSLEASQANVAFGYLSVLLANVCLTESGRNAVCDSLPGGDIDPLVEAIEEFVKHHKAVDQQGQSEMWTVFTGRLQGVADRLKS